MYAIRSYYVQSDTTDVLLESAWFEPYTVRRTSKRLGIHTDSSHRFERGADINMVPVALDRAAALIAELADGQICKGVIDAYPRRIDNRILTIGTDVITSYSIHYTKLYEMAHAVKDIYGAKVQVTIGPAIDNGFYYDFYCPDHTFSPEEFETIEKKMEELAKADLPITREVVTRDSAIQLFREMGETYKVELIESYNFV